MESIWWIIGVWQCIPLKQLLCLIPIRDGIKESSFRCLWFCLACEELKWMEATRAGNKLYTSICGAGVDQLPLFSYGRDGHQPYSRGLYTHYKDSVIKGGRSPIPNIRSWSTVAHIFYILQLLEFLDQLSDPWLIIRWHLQASSRPQTRSLEDFKPTPSEGAEKWDGNDKRVPLWGWWTFGDGINGEV